VVGHYRGDPAKFLGELGAVSSSVLEEDDVGIQAQLSEPAYCYLIAFLPNGKEDLCYPRDPAAAPPQQDKLLYPTAEGRFYGLDDGPGLEAFVLVASAEPLPAYADWKKAHGVAPWRPVPAREGIWHGNAQGLHWAGPLPRSERAKREAPQELADLLRHFREGARGAIVEMAAFAVAPRPKP
jgi:hypothetical protein